jgi:hypothetical protein
MKPAELRRSYEELVDAYRLLEAENAKLRARLDPKPEEPKQPVAPAHPTPGQFVDHVDKNGMLHRALVLEVLEREALRVKVFRCAVADLVLELEHAKSPEQRNCWKRRTR